MNVKAAEKRPKTAVVIVAAGSSRRFKDGSKQFSKFFGKPLVYWSLKAFADHPATERIVLVVRKNDVSPGMKILKSAGVKNGVIAIGGKTRHQSVKNGVSALGDRNGLIIVHDGARPLVSQNLISAVIKSASHKGACAPARPETDTTVITKGGKIIKYLDRDNLYNIETPQAFRASLWKHALKKAPKRSAFTDETSFLASAGIPVYIVSHNGFNPKITTREDLRLAEIRLKYYAKKCFA